MGEEIAQHLPSSSLIPPPPPGEAAESLDDSAAACPDPPLQSSASGDDPTAPPPEPQAPSTPPPPLFDPSRMIGIIKRKALIKDLAAVYHAECLSYCQQLLELQRKTEEPFVEVKHQVGGRKQPMRPPKRSKKVR